MHHVVAFEHVAAAEHDERTARSPGSESVTVVITEFKLTAAGKTTDNGWSARTGLPPAQ